MTVAPATGTSAAIVNGPVPELEYPTSVTADAVVGDAEVPLTAAVEADILAVTAGAAVGVAGAAGAADGDGVGRGLGLGLGVGEGWGVGKGVGPGCPVGDGDALGKGLPPAAPPAPGFDLHDVISGPPKLLRVYQ